MQLVSCSYVPTGFVPNLFAELFAFLTVASNSQVFALLIVRRSKTPIQKTPRELTNPSYSCAIATHTHTNNRQNALSAGLHLPVEISWISQPCAFTARTLSEFRVPSFWTKVLFFIAKHNKCVGLVIAT